jgi:hypothetical protein
MKASKVLIGLSFVYVLAVVGFETWLGYAQPAGQTSLIITTTGDDGVAHPRVVSRLDSAGKLYISANHWPRAWYHQALENPHVMVADTTGEPRAHTAVPIDGAERDRVRNAHPHSLTFRFLTGFPPRRFVRLDPISSGE